MSLNGDAGAQAAALDAAFRLARGEAVAQDVRASLPAGLADVAAEYGARQFQHNAQGLVPDPDLFAQMAGYLRIESALRLLIDGAIDEKSFIDMAGSHHVPAHLRHYYIGIARFRQGKVAKAMEYFSHARPQVEGQVVAYGRYVDGSIRGVVSARSFPEFEAICARASADRDEALFPWRLDPVVPRSRHCHIIGCDEGYWEKYGALFLTWAAPLATHVDFWINCTHFSDAAIARVRAQAPFAFLSIDDNRFANAMPYYTMTRFILAARLARQGAYDAIVCSDIDIFVDIHRYVDFVTDCAAGATAIYRRGSFPWRSSDAKFTVWKGAEGARMLQWVLAFFADVYRPDISGHNRQWWIDQYALALIAEVARGSYPAWSLGSVPFTAINRRDFPMKSPAEERMSKEDFARHFAGTGAG